MSTSSSIILVGSAPDSWGVWFPDDPGQTPYTRFLDEVAASGYQWIELGPFGYLPTDPKQLSDELAARNLQLSAGIVFEHLHQDDSWDAVWKLGQKDVARVMLEKGDSLTPNILPSHEPVDLGESWVAWLLARVSLDEATALIQ